MLPSRLVFVSPMTFQFAVRRENDCYEPSMMSLPLRRRVKVFPPRSSLKVRGYGDGEVVSENHRKIAEVEGVIVGSAKRDLNLHGFSDLGFLISVVPQERWPQASVGSSVSVLVR